uniref:Uncharacterized protein n=1 Tax=Anguilla anguilla TaxID=7936 RepID=A0A0E9X7E0_ANGAN
MAQNQNCCFGKNRNKLYMYIYIYYIYPSTNNIFQKIGQVCEALSYSRTQSRLNVKALNSPQQQSMGLNRLLCNSLPTRPRAGQPEAPINRAKDGRLISDLHAVSLAFAVFRKNTFSTPRVKSVPN